MYDLSSLQDVPLPSKDISSGTLKFFEGMRSIILTAAMLACVSWFSRGSDESQVKCGLDVKD
jgi:hypothetical protein